MGLWDRLFRRTDVEAKSGIPSALSSFSPGEERDYDRGIELYDTGRYQEAIAAFEAVLRNRRGGPLVERLARFYLAEAYSAAALANLRASDDMDTAVANMRTAISLNPNYADLHFRLGSTYLNADQPEEAIAPLRRAIEINPRYTQALIHLAVALLRTPQGDIQEALRLANRANEIGFAVGKPEFEAARDSIASDNRIAAAQALTALLISPENDRALLLAEEALDLCQRGFYPESESRYRAAIAIKPRYADLRNQLGIVVFAQDRPQEALEEFDIALEINPRYAEAHLNRSFALLRLHREDEAMTAVNTAMELDPDNAVAMVRLKKMFPQL